MWSWHCCLNCAHWEHFEEQYWSVESWALNLCLHNLHFRPEAKRSLTARMLEDVSEEEWGGGDGLREGFDGARPFCGAI